MNLLPTTEKEILKEGLKSRFEIISFFLMTISFLIGFVMLLPGYVLTLDYFSQDKTAESQENSHLNQEILNIPKNINAMLAIFGNGVGRAPVEDSIYEVISKMPEGIVINSISFSRNERHEQKNGVLISLSGIAPDRESLISFSTLLKDVKEFSSVDVPVSSLAKSKNLPFTMNVFIIN